MSSTPSVNNIAFPASTTLLSSDNEIGVAISELRSRIREIVAKAMEDLKAKDLAILSPEAREVLPMDMTNYYKAKSLADYYINYRKNLTLDAVSSSKALPLGNLARALLIYSENYNLQPNIDIAIFHGKNFTLASTNLSVLFKDAIKTDSEVAQSIEYFKKAKTHEPMFVAFAEETIDFLTHTLKLNEIS